MKKDILTLLDLEKKDFDRLIARALEIKERYRRGVRETSLAGKTIGLIFDKASTRTRLAYEAGMAQMGGVSLFIHTAETQMSRNEPIQDTARVMSGYLDGIAIRTYSHQWLEEFSGWATVPVINALTDSYHPTQVLGDLLTVTEHKGSYEGLSYAWVGDGNNMANSWINAAAVCGFKLTLACPEGYKPDPEILSRAKAAAADPEKIVVVDSPADAVDGADVVNTDVWASMGQEDQQAERENSFKGYQIDDAMMAGAADGAIVMHCLPAHRGEEISESVLEGPASVVWDQAENKMHMAKAIFAVLMTA